MHCSSNGSDLFYATVGLIFVAVLSILWAFKIFIMIKTFVLCRIFEPVIKKNGGWAVVTGSTDGIGKAYAKELAKIGFNLVLISRNKEKLDLTCKEIEDMHGIRCITIQADFSCGEAIYPKIRDGLQELDIDILVNNVGTLGRHPCKFLNVPPEECIEYLNTNVLSAVMMCQIVIPLMVKKRFGYVVNMSSISSVLPLPLKSSYSASKAFLTSLSRSLHYEYHDIGVTIQTLIPSYISTKLVEFSNFLQKPNLFVPDATTYARSAVCTLQVASVTTGYWTHGLQCLFIESVPRNLYLFSTHFVQMSLDSRKRKHID